MMTLSTDSFNAKHHLNGKPYMLSVENKPLMLSIIMLNAIMLSVIMLSVTVPVVACPTPCHAGLHSKSRELTFPTNIKLG